MYSSVGVTLQGTIREEHSKNKINKSKNWKNKNTEKKEKLDQEELE